MNLGDIIFIFQWWIMLAVIGAIFLPITSLIFSNFFDKGYIFSKILGIAFLSYFIFIVGISKILPFTTSTIILLIWISLLGNLFILKRKLLFIIIKERLPVFIFEEFLFLIALSFWSFIRANQPDIHGLEKYMDYGFVNSIIRSEYFPPKDMWFPPFSINYYYFGHLVTAMLTKLSNIPSSITYNLMLSTIFALTFTASFSIGANLIKNLKLQISNLKLITGGLLTAFLVAFAGNLQVIYAFFKSYGETPVPFWQLPFSISAFPNSYWYPNATRFIHNTIHEFPIYSFVVSDLHGHVLDIPFVLLTIALLLSLLLKSQVQNHKSQINLNIKNQKKDSSLIAFWNLEFGIWNLLLISFLLAIMYMTNAWDGIIYLLLASIIFFYLKQYEKIILLFLVFIVLSLPFSLSFKPFASGIGVLCAPDFLTNLGNIGPFLFEKDHCQRSPFWQLMILYGFFYFWVISFLFKIKITIQNSKTFKNLGFKHLNFIKNLKLKIENLPSSDLFILILIGLSTLLIIIPEFIYIKDIYPAHYRANTMFKLVYQSFIMLSISSSYIIYRLISNWKMENGKWKFPILIGFGSIGLFLVMIYPYFAINSYYEDLKNYKGLNGISYLKNLYPNDYQAILWLNKNIKGQPVILEAQGDSYTDYSRISANTGLPTVVGWPVHEWLWRGTYDIPAPRITDVQTLYETDDLKIAKNLIKKYNIEFIFLGDLEREKYTKLNENIFKELGTLIFQNSQTKIYQIK